jgi:transposase
LRLEPLEKNPKPMQPGSGGTDSSEVPGARLWQCYNVGVSHNNRGEFIVGAQRTRVTISEGEKARMLPHDFPKKGIVYYYFRKWSRDGTWKKINDTLRSLVRTKNGEKTQPSAAVIDTQSAKTTAEEERGAMMLESTSRGESDIWLSMPRG